MLLRSQSWSKGRGEGRKRGRTFKSLYPHLISIQSFLHLPHLSSRVCAPCCLTVESSWGAHFVFPTATFTRHSTAPGTWCVLNNLLLNSLTFLLISSHLINMRLDIERSSPFTLSLLHLLHDALYMVTTQTCLLDPTEKNFGRFQVWLLTSSKQKYG